MKLYQVVNANDVFMYNVRGKRTLHSLKSGYHRCSHLFIEVFGGRFIIQKKAKSTENGGLWSSSVSGHLEAGESYETAIVREAREELGLDIEVPELEKILKKMLLILQ